MADEPVITKKRVTMRKISIVLDPDGKPIPLYDADGNEIPGAYATETHEVVDYVRPDFLDAYVADAKTRWQTVEVSDEPDAGPGGYHGATHVPAGLDHPFAGQTFEATPEDQR